MKIIEEQFNVDREGKLVIPAEILRSINIFPGDVVFVAFISEDGVTNYYHEFTVSGEPFRAITPENHLAIPNELMEKANIPDDAQVQIICADGAIVLAPTNRFSVEELNAILSDLVRAGDITAQLPPDICESIQMLEEYINDAEEEEDQYESV